MARSEPPGRLRSSTGSPYELHQAACADISACVSLPGLLRNLFSHRLGESWCEARTPHLYRTVSFQPRGILDIRMSLSTLVRFRRRSAAASLWSVRNPCVIQADSEPPGRRPPAPGSHVRRIHSSPKELSLAQVRWSFPRLSSIPAPSRSSSRSPKL